MAEQNACSCGKLCYNMVFACSGAADVGAIADQAARQLAREKKAMPCCTAAIAAGISEIAEKARGAAKIVVFDGCDKECSKKVLEKAGFGGFVHIQLGEMGMEKGKSPVTDVRIAMAAQRGAESLA